MRFYPTSLAGLVKIELEPREDSRGFLTRSYCAADFAAQGLNTHWPQCNHTGTFRQGSIRGMHFQANPRPETKLIRCVAGRIFDVIVDVRPQSPTFGRFEAFELSPQNPIQLYVPGGFAHGFQCLEDNSEVMYMMSESYFPELARGLRYDDGVVAIPWPLPVADISPRDQTLPAFNELNLK